MTTVATDIPIDLPPAIRGYVRRFSLRRRRLALVRRAGLSLAVAALLALGVCLADRLLRLSEGVRVGALVAVVAVLVLPLTGPAVRLVRRVKYLDSAREIERRSPQFGQRLVTLVSQYELPVGQRGSTEFLASMAEEVEEWMGAARVSRLVPWTRAAGPWFLVALCAGLVVVALRADWVELPTLARRLATPTSGVPPVTTTTILVSPGPIRVVEGGAVVVQAYVRPVPDGDVVLRVAAPEQSTSVMTRRSAGGPYEVTFPHVDRPFRYTVAAGDAESPSYTAEVLRRPAVADVRVRYTYPAYTRWSPATVAVRDGLVEAPAGTMAVVRVTSTEPLRSGSLVAAGGVIGLKPTGDARVVEGEVSMTADQRYTVDLLSAEGVEAKGVTRLLVRPTADRGPSVRMSQPVDDLRLDPHAVLPVGYEAEDDVGVLSVTARLRINGEVTKDVAVPLAGLPGRAADGVFDLDLAPLELKVGDVVAVSVVAADGRGQVASSEARHVLITPRTIDIKTYQRVAELKEAAQAAGSLVGSLEGAVAAAVVVGGARDGADGVKKVSALNGQLAGAAEAQGALRRAVLGALARSDSAGLSTTLANVADSLTVCGTMTARGAVREALGVAKELRGKAEVVARGQQAAATLADRSNLRSAATRPTTRATAERAARTLERARADVTAAAVALGMDVNTPDLDARLQQLVDAAEALTKGERPVRYAGAAGEWAKGGDDSFAERLEAAASVEELRADGDAGRAADLRLVARAVRATAEGASRPAAVEARARMAGAVAALEGTDVKARGEARGMLRRWAGETDLLLAAAEAINRQVEVGRRPTTAPVAGVESAGAIREVQEALAGMPEDLARLLAAVDASRAARGRAEALRREAATAPAGRQGVARRMAEQAETARQGAAEVVTSAARALDPSAAAGLSLRLQGVAPEPAAGIESRLTPALKALKEAVGSPETVSIEAAASLTRQAIGQVQADLRRAQEGMAVGAGVEAPRVRVGRLSLADPNVVPYRAPARPRAGEAPAGYERAVEAYFEAVARLSAGAGNK